MSMQSYRFKHKIIVKPENVIYMQLVDIDMIDKTWGNFDTSLCMLIAGNDHTTEEYLI